MAQRRALDAIEAAIDQDDDPVGFVVVENSRVSTSDSTDDADTDGTLSAGAKAALQAIGGWTGLDWDDAFAELERIRRESKSSPPIDL